jgi:hypothetical protein
VPDAHVFVPFTAEQTVPQAPQLELFVLRLISHPVEANVSQSPYPALQLMEQTLPAQDGVPFVPLHACPHPPQFAALVARLVSQPFAALLSQFPKPELHVGTQALDVQAVVPFALLQGLVHAPQLLMSLVVLVSQPFEALPSQFP